MEPGAAHLAAVAVAVAGAGVAAARRRSETSAATPTGELCYLQLAALAIRHTAQVRTHDVACRRHCSDGLHEAKRPPLTACNPAAETGTMTPRRRQRRKRHHSGPRSARRGLTWRSCWLRRSRLTVATTTGKHSCRRARLQERAGAMMRVRWQLLRLGVVGPCSAVCSAGKRWTQRADTHRGNCVREACSHGGSFAPPCCRARVNLAQDVGLPPESAEGAYQVRPACGGALRHLPLPAGRCGLCARVQHSVWVSSAHGGPRMRVLCQPRALGSLPTCCHLPPLSAGPVL